MDSVPWAMLLLNTQGDILAANHHYHRLEREYSNTPSGFLSRLLAELPVTEVLQPQQIHPFQDREVEFLFETGMRCFSCSGYWLPSQKEQTGIYEQKQGGHESVLLLAAREITSFKKQNQINRINKIRISLAAEERFLSTREVLHGAIHQIQAPFHRLTTALTLAPCHYKNHALKQAIDEAIETGNHVLEKLRHSTPMEVSPKWVPVNLNELLSELLALYTEPLAALDIQIKWQLAPLLPSLLGQERKLMVLFKQLLDNAVDAIHFDKKNPREIRIITQTTGGFIHVKMADTGHGIPPEIGVKIFEPFFTTKHYAGEQHSGMGLTIAQEIATMHDGGIMVNTDCPIGCEMFVELPIKRNIQD